MKLRYHYLLGLFLCTEAALAATPPNPIYWDETQSFSLTRTLDPITRYEGQAAPGIGSLSDETTLSFHGALPGFTLAGQAYALSQVVVTLNSVWNMNFRLGGFDSAWLSDIYVQGSVLQAANIVTPMSSGVDGVGSRSWVGEGSWENSWVENPAAHQWDWYFHDPLSVSYTWSNTSAFKDKATVDFLLGKYVLMGLTGYNGDDNWDYVSNPQSDWSGSLKVSYVYTTVVAAPPVPEPTHLALFAAGLAMVGIRVLRRDGRTTRLSA